MQRYQHLTRDELMRLALERDELTEEAQLALDAEISSRQITSVDLSSFRAESLAAQTEQDRKIGPITTSAHIGKNFLGRKNLSQDPRLRIEEFDTTLWFFALWFPIFPIGTYRIRRLYRRRWSFCTSDAIHVLQKYRGRDWEQILVTWIKAMLALLLLRLLVPYGLRLFVYR
jgi:hypothetical protein